MINIEEVTNYNTIKSLHRKLWEEILSLKTNLDTERQLLTKKLKKERYQIIKAIKRSLKNPNEADSETIAALERKIEEKRNELYLKRDKELAALEDAQTIERERLEEIESEYQQLSKIIAGVNKQRRNRTNEEHLTLITNALEELGQEDYSIRIFNKKFTYVDIGSHSDFPRSLRTKTKGVVAIAKKDMDISKIPEEVISYPEENEDFYASGEFILYEKLDKSVEESIDFFTKHTYISESLPGMSNELAAAIDDKLYAEYRNSLAAKKVKVNN